MAGKNHGGLDRWFKEKWTDSEGNACGSDQKDLKKCRPSKRVSPKTPITWSEMSERQKKKAVSEKKRVGMGKRTKAISRKKK